jgi:hypothetical protein
MLVYARIGIGCVLGALAVALFAASLPRINVLGPLVLVAASVWLVVGPKKILAAQRAANERYRQHLETDVRARRMEQWSRWLNWIGFAMSFVWILVWIEYLPALSSFLAMMIAALPFAASLVLSQTAVISWFRSTRR